MTADQQRPSEDVIVETILSFLMTGALSYGNRFMPLIARMLYQSYWNGRVIDHSDSEVEAVICAVERINQRWPGSFTCVWPPRPRPEDLAQEIWIMQKMAFFPNGLFERNIVQKVYDVAKGLGTS